MRSFVVSTSSSQLTGNRAAVGDARRKVDVADQHDAEGDLQLACDFGSGHRAEFHLCPVAGAVGERGEDVVRVSVVRIPRCGVGAAHRQCCGGGPAGVVSWSVEGDRAVVGFEVEGWEGEVGCCCEGAAAAATTSIVDGGGIGAVVPVVRDVGEWER